MFSYLSRKVMLASLCSHIFFYLNLDLIYNAHKTRVESFGGPKVNPSGWFSPLSSPIFSYRKRLTELAPPNPLLFLSRMLHNSIIADYELLIALLKKILV
jgi:hypothetical protein